MTKIIKFKAGLGIWVPLFLFFGFSGFNLSIHKAWASDLQRREIFTPFTPLDTKNIKVAFFDADSTLRVTQSGTVTPNHPDDFVVLPLVSKALKILSESGYLIYIVSNQLGIHYKISTLETTEAALSNLVRAIQREGGVVHGFDFAESPDSNRKPEIGMATRLERLLQEKWGPQTQIDRTQSFMVGDSGYASGKDLRPDGTPGDHHSNSDRLFAERLGIKFFEPKYLFGWEIMDPGAQVYKQSAHLEHLRAYKGPMPRFKLKF